MNDFELIIGRELSAVSFIRDYVRFEFDPPPTIDALTKVTIATPTETVEYGSDRFANVAIGLIGQHRCENRF